MNKIFIKKKTITEAEKKSEDANHEKLEVLLEKVLDNLTKIQVELKEIKIENAKTSKNLENQMTDLKRRLARVPTSSGGGPR